MLEYKDRYGQKSINSTLLSLPYSSNEDVFSQYTFCTENAYLTLQVDFHASSSIDEWSTPYYTVLSVNHLGEYSSIDDGYVEEYPDVFHDEDSEIIFESDNLEDLYHFLQSQSIVD
ncbi:hypothetical protein [uncultured Shewanella sp.]|uniref:hypothetical protein n=1 Tax=uncultured Shewanella sp. TaxID=173975 RepID=UPI00262FEB75|nr:hypothetical protein [uncultured Shewanella sp.]